MSARPKEDGNPRVASKDSDLPVKCRYDVSARRSIQLQSNLTACGYGWVRENFYRRRHSAFSSRLTTLRLHLH